MADTAENQARAIAPRQLYRATVTLPIDGSATAVTLALRVTGMTKHMIEYKLVAGYERAGAVKVLGSATIQRPAALGIPVQLNPLVFDGLTPAERRLDWYLVEA